MHFEETHSEMVARPATAPAAQLGMSALQSAYVAEGARLRDIEQLSGPDCSRGPRERRGGRSA
jgi:hypothetical protein